MSRLSPALLKQSLLILLNVEANEAVLKDSSFERKSELVNMSKELQGLMEEIYEQFETYGYKNPEKNQRAFIEYVGLFPKFIEFCRDIKQLPLADNYVRLIKQYRSALTKSAVKNVFLFLSIDKTSVVEKTRHDQAESI